MFRSPWLESLPVIAVEPEALSEYRLRVAVRDHQLGTAEVAIPLLERLGYPEAARRLRRISISSGRIIWQGVRINFLLMRRAIQRLLQKTDNPDGCGYNRLF